MLDQHRDVVAPLAQRRHVDLDDVQTVVEIFPETSFLHALHKIGIRGSDDPDVHGDDPRVANRGEFLGLDDMEQFDLERLRQFTDLVQEQGAGVRHGDEAFLVLVGRREGAFFVAEELAFEQVLRDGPAVDGDKWLVFARSCFVDRLGNESLACSAFAGDQDIAFVRDHLFHDAEDLLHGFRAPDDIREGCLTLAQFLSQDLVLHLELSALEDPS